MGVTVSGYGAPFDGTIPKLSYGNDFKILNMLKVTGLYALKG